MHIGARTFLLFKPKYPMKQRDIGDGGVCCYLQWLLNFVRSSSFSEVCYKLISWLYVPVVYGDVSNLKQLIHANVQIMHGLYCGTF